MSNAEPTPEAVLEIQYLLAFRRLRNLIFSLALALLVACGVGGWGIYTLATDNATHASKQQVTALACGVVDQIPPGDPLTDYIRVLYRCGSYNPSKAQLQPRPTPSPTGGPTK